MSRKDDIKKMMDNDCCKKQLEKFKVDISSNKLCKDCLNYGNRKVVK